MKDWGVKTHNIRQSIVPPEEDFTFSIPTVISAALRAAEKAIIVRRFKVIGKSHPRLDGPETATGRATNTVDVVLPSMLQPALSQFRPPRKDQAPRHQPSARTSGRRGGLTADDVPRKRFGFTIQDERFSPAKSALRGRCHRRSCRRRRRNGGGGHRLHQLPSYEELPGPSASMTL